MKPKLALCNFMSDLNVLRNFALRHGFSGVDWSFDLQDLRLTPADESRCVRAVAALQPLEVRYHCPFDRVDLGHEDPQEAKAAEALFQRIIRLVANAQGRYLTIHIGLGHKSTEPLSWNGTIENLTRLVQYGAVRNVRVCLENLAWGWTSRPHLFEKIIRASGAGVTFDIGHAYVCEAVRSQDYGIEDFLSPHADRVANAHVYHAERAGVGHVPPMSLQDIEGRLALLGENRCAWWVLEIKNTEGLLQTKGIIDEYLTRLNASAKLRGKSPT